MDCLTQVVKEVTHMGGFSVSSTNSIGLAPSLMLS